MVINIAPHDSANAIPNEAELVSSLGMQYINIPVNWNSPTRDDLLVFMDTMDASRDKKIHVHCEANFRASAFIALYRIVRLKWNPDEALTTMHIIWDEDTYPAWKMFMENSFQRNDTGL